MSIRAATDIVASHKLCAGAADHLSWSEVGADAKRQSVLQVKNGMSLQRCKGEVANPIQECWVAIYLRSAENRPSCEILVFGAQ